MWRPCTSCSARTPVFAPIHGLEARKERLVPTRAIETLGDLRFKRVFIRSDSNVPLKDGKITDGDRIRAALSTLTHLVEAGVKVVVMAHLGRPKGKVDLTFSLASVAKRLGELVDAPITLTKDVVGESVKATVEALKDGEIAPPENVRYDARGTPKVDEERSELATAYVELGNVFVSDGLGIVHRKQTSVYDVAKLLPFASGLLVLKEIEPLRETTDNPERPYGVVLDGSKVFDKLGVIVNLLKRTDRLFIGDGMVFTSFVAQSHSVGKPLLKEEQTDTVKGYIAEVAERGVELVLPIDVVAAPEFIADAPVSVVTVDQIPADQMDLDTGPESRKLFAEEISSAKTIAWNGPTGVFEFPVFAEDTKAVAKTLFEGDMFSVIGGGGSAAAVWLFGFDESTFSHISIGGGASLELLEDKVLFDIAALED